MNTRKTGIYPTKNLVSDGKGNAMETSARNQLRGTVTSVVMGAVMAEVTLDVNGVEVVAAITKESAERLALADGKHAVAIIKATDVMVGVD